MKCGHCAAKLERHAWFCPNCKRGVRRAGGATRPAKRPVGLFLTTGLVCMALGASLGSRWRPEAVAAAPMPVPVASSTPAASPTPSASSAIPAADSSLHLTALSTADPVIPNGSRATRAPLSPSAAVQIRTLSPDP